ncbi:restriction endonuclease subunit S [Ruminococcus bicirculans (ex Wegman et al. 2014)]|uniref:restriction endonuclease subunit S n=2 Tax=Ruminococcus bicirculans (ex Wegman et al. 2014) TaxID=1160721 RepID=UPI003FD8B0EB
MSKINQLIQNHCPAGVEYKKLEDVLTIKNGRDYKQFGDGDVPVYGSGGIMTYINTAVYDKPSVLIPRKGSLDKLYYVDTPFWNVDTIFYTDIDTSLVEPKYIYYYLEGQHLERLNKAGGVPSLTQAVLNKVQLPVPPLEVQREIVRILDNFTSLKAELQTKLQAELQARKKQYEYYRDKLLSFASDIPLFQLGKVCDLQAGKAIKASEISDIETNQETIPCYGANGLRGYVGKSNQKGDKSIIGRQGAQCGNVCYATGKYYATEHAVVVTDKGYFNSRYLFHVLTHANLNQYKTAGAQPGLSVSKLNNVMIAVPDKKVQDKIANILDNFEKICSDLNIGLPAEIEARQKQYEFYRDALLSFDNSYFVNVERERERERER